MVVRSKCPPHLDFLGVINLWVKCGPDLIVVPVVGEPIWLIWKNLRAELHHSFEEIFS